MFVHTIYQSRACARITENDIAAITAKSLPNNVKNGLTGFLYYDGSRFLQIIEGRPAEVAATMKRITNNSLHHSVMVRLMNRSSFRNFEDWPFGVLNNQDPELNRITRNMGIKDLLSTNVLDTVKVLKRAAGRKRRVMSAAEKQVLANLCLVKAPQTDLVLTQDMLKLCG